MSNKEQINALCNYWLLALKSPSFESIVKNYLLEISDNLYEQINQGKSLDCQFIEKWLNNNKQTSKIEKIISSKSSDFSAQSKNIKTKKNKPISQKKTNVSIEIDTQEENIEETENQELLVTEISVLLVWGFFNQKKSEKSFSVMSMGVMIDLQSGKICADKNLPPRINRKFLNPIQGSDLIVGEFEQSVNFVQTHPVPESDHIGQWITYAEDFLKATCSVKSLDEIKHSQWESWQFTKRFYYTEKISKAVRENASN